MQRETRKPGPNRASASHLRLVEADSARSAPTLPTRARDRIVIVPLDTPSPAQFRPMGDAQLAREADVPSLAPPLPPTVDRRQQWPGRPEDRDPLARLACPKCGTRARIDHVDLRWARVHLSCDSCCWMWQDRVRETDRPRVGPPPRS